MTWPSFDARKHFDSGRRAVCVRCERIGEDGWPPGWGLGDDGIMCLRCMFPSAEIADDGTVIRFDTSHPSTTGDTP